MNLKPKVEEIQETKIDEIIDQYEAEPRKLHPRIEFGIGIIATLLSLFQIYTSWRGPIGNLIQKAVHIGFAFLILFLIYPPKRKSPRRNQIPWIDWVAVALVLISTIWIIVNEERFIENPRDSTIIDLILGVIMIILVLEGARRIIGPVLPLMAILLIFYALLGPYIPGSWIHRGFSIRMLIETLYMSAQGIYGMVTGISATVIAGFLIFGVMLQKMGGGETFVDLSIRIAGKSHGGPAKVSCFSSAFFGTISGSAVANVVVDGVFNIPLMKSQGYKSEFAAAVEATTSTGGQIMPPIMGAGAFIMAEILGIPYARVALGAAIPAILYYVGCYAGVHFEAQRLQLKPLPSDMIPSFRKKILPKSLPFILPVSVLVYFLSTGYSPPLSVLYAVLISTGWHLIPIGKKETFKMRVKQIMVALEGGGKAIVLVAALCICAQMVICLFNLTGIGVKISQMIIEAAHEKVFLTLFMGMIICILLGMGIPTTAAYVLAASVVAPIIITLGGHPFSVHLFIFYFAIISAITPPVCAAVYVASAIAHSNWWKTGWIAVRLGLAGFIIPFMFFYAPTLLLYGKPVFIVINSITACIGVIVLSAAVMGFFLRPLSWVERLLLIVSAFLMIDPRLSTDIIGLLIAGAIYANQKFRRPRPK